MIEFLQSLDAATALCTALALNLGLWLLFAAFVRFMGWLCGLWDKGGE